MWLTLSETSRAHTLFRTMPPTLPQVDSGRLECHMQVFILKGFPQLLERLNYDLRAVVFFVVVVIIIIIFLILLN